MISLDMAVLTEVIKTKQNSALMQRINAFLNNECVGYGFLFYRDDGRIIGPDLYTPTGERLDEGWYQLQVTDEMTLIVIPRSKQ